MIISLIILACLSAGDIAENYYGEDSFRIASADSVCGEGYARQLALNRIARANYKHENYRRALEFARKVDADHEGLYWDTRSLLALLHQNLGRLGQADSIYQEVLAADIAYRQILYEVHLNYAELMRLRLDYDSRERHLLEALARSEGWRHRKTLRVLARHYFNVLRDFEAAENMIERHGTPETDEGKAGYALVQAEFYEAKESYFKARKYYLRAMRQAETAGFVAFQYDAADGYMRSQVLSNRANPYQLAFFVLIFAIIFWYALYNAKGL